MASGWGSFIRFSRGSRLGRSLKILNFEFKLILRLSLLAARFLIFLDYFLFDEFCSFWKFLGFSGSVINKFTIVITFFQNPETILLFHPSRTHPPLFDLATFLPNLYDILNLLFQLVLKTQRCLWRNNYFFKVASKQFIQRDLLATILL